MTADRDTWAKLASSTVERVGVTRILPSPCPEAVTFLPAVWAAGVVMGGLAPRVGSKRCRAATGACVQVLEQRKDERLASRFISWVAFALLLTAACYGRPSFAEQSDRCHDPFGLDLPQAPLIKTTNGQAREGPLMPCPPRDSQPPHTHVRTAQLNSVVVLSHYFGRGMYCMLAVA